MDMHRHPNLERWLHGLLAVAFMLGLLAPLPVMVALPDWMGDAICHAPGDDGPAHEPATAVHVHCALCLAGQAMVLPPVPRPPRAPSVTTAEYRLISPHLWPGPGPNRSYASRAPPRMA